MAISVSPPQQLQLDTLAQQNGGHKVLNTLRIYLKVTQEETDKAIAKLPSWNKDKRGKWFLIR